MSDRPCARAERCATRTPDGPAMGPRAFCDTDRGIVGQAVTALPGLYRQLAAALGDRPRTGGPRTSGGHVAPPVPLNLGVDALMRELLEVVASWDERVRTVARLSGPDTHASLRRRGHVALTHMCATLAAHLDALLALPNEPMARHLSVPDAAGHAATGAAGVVHPAAGYATVLVDLDGADAGLELLDLHRRALATLGLTPRHQHLPIPCTECGLRTVARRDGAAGLEDQAACTTCGQTYTHEHYRQLLDDLKGA